MISWVGKNRRNRGHHRARVVWCRRGCWAVSWRCQIGWSALSDALSFGAIAGRSAVHYARQLKKQIPLDKKQLQEVQQRIDALVLKKGGIDPFEAKKERSMGSQQVFECSEK